MDTENLTDAIYDLIDSAFELSTGNTLQGVWQSEGRDKIREAVDIWIEKCVQ